MFWADHINPEDGPEKVSIKRGEWFDSARGNRKVPYKVYYPRNVDSPRPVIIWSHGLGGSRDGAGFISRYLCAHGYVVVHIQHAGTDMGLWLGKDGHPWDVIRDAHIGWDDVENRILDVPFVVTQLQDGNIEGVDPTLLDFSKLGMSGHSMGALSTQAMAGQRYGPNDTAAHSYKDDRFTAHLAYSQLPSWDEDADHAGMYGGISEPIFFMTGTNDKSPISGDGYEPRMRVYDLAGTEDKNALIITDADHMVFSGSRGQLPGYDKIPQHEEIIKISSLAWWEWHLRGDEAAKDWLLNSFENWLGSEGRFF